MSLSCEGLFFGRKRIGDLGNGLRNGFNNSPRGGPPTHPLLVTGGVEIFGVKNPEKGADEETREELPMIREPSSAHLGKLKNLPHSP
jgi:hypothetical protein